MTSTIDTGFLDQPGDVSKQDVKNRIGEAAKADINQLFARPALRGDGGHIFEAVTVDDPATQFTPGATFVLDPGNPRHFNVIVGDATSPLTANMTIDIQPGSALWQTADRVTIAKGDGSAYTVTVHGLGAGGDDYVLTQQDHSLQFVYVSTDGSTGPGLQGQAFQPGTVGGGPGAGGVASISMEFQRRTPAVSSDEMPISLDDAATDAAGDKSIDRHIEVANDDPGSPLVVRLPLEPPVGLSFLFRRPAAQTGDVQLLGALNPVTRNGTRANGSDTITGISSVTDYRIGDVVTGEGIPADAVIIDIPSSSSIQIDKNATSAGTDEVTVTTDWAVIDGYRGLTLPRVTGGRDAVFTLLRCVARPAGAPPVWNSSERSIAGLRAPVVSVSGTLNPDLHSGCILLATGNVTVPAAAGFNATIVSDGAYTVGAGGAPVSLASGEAITVMVMADGAILHTPALALSVLATS